jgi:hypothetical protein
MNQLARDTIYDCSAEIKRSSNDYVGNVDAPVVVGGEWLFKTRSLTPWSFAKTSQLSLGGKERRASFAPQPQRVDVTFFKTNM